MNKFDIVEDRCRNNCELYERCVRYALKNRTMRCIYFSILKEQVDSIVQDFNEIPHVHPVTSNEIRKILRRKR